MYDAWPEAAGGTRAGTLRRKADRLMVGAKRPLQVRRARLRCAWPNDRRVTRWANTV